MALVAITGISAFYSTLQIEKTAYHVLYSIQEGDFNEALRYIHLNEPTKRANDIDAILKTYAKELSECEWSIRATVREGNDAWIIIYLNPEPGSATGTVKYVYMYQSDEGWVVSPVDNSFFKGIKWVNGK